MSSEDSKIPFETRLTHLSTIVWEEWGEPPQSIALSSVAVGGYAGDVYTRRVKVTEEWKDIDLGWVSKPRLVVISNEIPKPTRNLSEEEKAEIAKKIIEVRCGEGDGWEVVAGSFFQGCPVGKIQSRSLAGAFKVRVTAYPE